MEGATFGLWYGLDTLKKQGFDPTEIRLVGGGAKSPPLDESTRAVPSNAVAAQYEEFYQEYVRLDEAMRPMF